MRSAVVVLKRESPAVAGHSWSGARGTRTPDLLGAIQALSQLSYSPEERTVYRRIHASRGCGNGPNAPIRSDT
jgi:hypothetical protein